MLDCIKSRKKNAMARAREAEAALTRAEAANYEARTDLLRILQEERKAAKAAEWKTYTVQLTKEQAQDAIRLLGWDLTITESLAGVDGESSEKARVTLANLREPLRAQYAEYFVGRR